MVRGSDIMKITFNNGYYIVKTATREAQYRADILTQTHNEYEVRVALLQRKLRDLEAIAQYIKENDMK